MAFRVELSPRALSDLEKNYLYLKKDSLHQANEWFNSITDAIRSLEVLPKRCKVAFKIQEIGQTIRSLVSGKGRYPFIIFFYISGENESPKTVRIAHIRHGAQEKLQNKNILKTIIF